MQTSKYVLFFRYPIDPSPTIKQQIKQSPSCYRPQGKVMFSQVTVCPQSATWLLRHWPSLLQHSQYISYWYAFLLPPANEVWGKVICLQACVCPQGEGEYLTRYPPSPGPGTPPRTRYTPLDQVHPQQGTPPGTRSTPQDQVHPPGPGTPPWTRYTPQTRCPPRTRYTPTRQSFR